MIYDRVNLKIASMRGDRVGEYKGIKVYSCSKEDYNKNMNSNFHYIIYDDSYLSGRPLVRKNKVIGYVNVDGLIDLLRDDEQWEYLKTKKKVKKKNEMKNKKESEIDLILKSVFEPLKLEEISLEELGEI